MTNKLPVRLAIEEWLPRAALCLVTVFCVAAMATIVEATQTGEDSLNTHLLRTNGGLGHEIWDVTEPASPTFVTTVAEMGMSASREGEGEVDTHKHYWECATGIAYLIGSADGW